LDGTHGPDRLEKVYRRELPELTGGGCSGFLFPGMALAEVGTRSFGGLALENPIHLAAAGGFHAHLTAGMAIEFEFL